MKCRWTDIAIENLNSVQEYLSDTSPASADAVVDRIFSAIEILERYPQMGRNGRVAETRELVVTGTPFIVCYRISNERILILAVQHGAKRWPKAF